MNTLQDLFLQETRQLLGAERHIAALLPKIAGTTLSKELRTALSEHTAQTQSHIHRLENLIEAMGQPVAPLPCPSLEALTSETQEHLSQIDDPALKDAFLIAAQQKVEHFEIASYGTARSHALQLALDDAADLLQRTLDEEKTTDERLSLIAENRINEEANIAEMPRRLNAPGIAERPLSPPAPPAAVVSPAALNQAMMNMGNHSTTGGMANH